MTTRILTAIALLFSLTLTLNVNAQEMPSQVDAHYYENIFRYLFTPLENGQESTTNNQKVEFEIYPGGNPSDIQLLQGNTHLVSSENDGTILIQLDGNNSTMQKPYAYQVRPDGSQEAISVEYKLQDDRLSFVVGSYEMSQSLVIGFTTVGYNSQSEIFSTQANLRGPGFSMAD